jgi:nitrogenase molybdenum-iron protein alpha/beta subunit
MATLSNTVTDHAETRQCSQGGCALRGAKLVLQPITNAVHVVHGSASCLGHVWASRPTASSGSHLHRCSVTTALGEVELIMGGSERLQGLLDRVAAELAPAAIFVYQSCLTAMFGEDLRAECKSASLRLGVPVLTVEAPGLAGGKQTGHRLAVRLLCEQVIGTIEPAFRGNADINLIGEFNVHGEVAQLRSLLRSLGIRILASIPGDARYQEIATAHRAKVSLDLCSQAMPQLAEYLHAQYSIPFVRGSVYGSRAFADTLRHLASVLVANGADAEVEQRVCAWLDKEQQRFKTALAKHRSRLDGKRVMIYAGGVKTWSLIEDLQAAGLIVRGVSLHKCSEHDKELHTILRKKCRKTGLKEWKENELEGLLKAGGVDLVLSGGGMKYLAHKYGLPCVEISHERTFSLLGFDGMLNLLEEIDLLVNSPVLRLVHEKSDSPRSTINATPAKIVTPPSGCINPFALTQPTGATLALQGVRGCSPLLFGAQGCATSGLVFLSRYFGEQINLSTVNMNDSDTIYGGQTALREAVAELEKDRPEMIAVISTGAMDMQGASAVMLPRKVGAQTTEMIFLHTPDFEGSLEQGWGKATRALVNNSLHKHCYRPPSNTLKLLILPGAHLSIGDLEWLKEAAEAFGLTPLVVPDISTALDGHAGDRAVIDGGVATSQIEQMVECLAYLALGDQMSDAAGELSLAGMPGLTLSAWTGMRQTDEILNRLAAISGQPIPKKYRIQRMRLLDAMVDHLHALSRIRAAVAAEPDLLADLCGWLRELGVRDLVVVSPVPAPSLRALPVDEVYVGDYQVLASHLSGSNLLLAPDSAQDVAHEAGIAHYSIGIHEPRRAGDHFRIRVGYQGALEQVYSVVNQVLYRPNGRSIGFQP